LVFSRRESKVGPENRRTLVVEGKTTYVFHLPDGRRVKGQDFICPADWPWHDSTQLPSVRYARLTATSLSSGVVTVIIVAAPGWERCYLLCRATPLAAPRLIQAWRHRSWIEPRFRTPKHLLAAEACQVPTEDACYGHPVLHLPAGLVLLYTACVVCRAKVTMEEILFSLKHYWRFLDSELLELFARSRDLYVDAA
jgi:hypothetical protein